MRFTVFSALTMAMGLSLVAGCDKKSDDAAKYLGKAKCETDKDCAKGHICVDKECNKGERSKQELAAADKAEADKRKAEAAKKTAVKPGEGSLTVRICTGFKNTPEAIGTIVATHAETKKKHYIDLALAVPDGGFETEFTYHSLPLGKYEVYASYGIQVRGKPDGVHKLNCHEKIAKDACKDEVVRLMEVVLPKDAPKRTVKENGKLLRLPCDWIAE